MSNGLNDTKSVEKIYQFNDKAGEMLEMKETDLTDRQSNRYSISKSQMSAYEKNLYLYHEEMPERLRVATLLDSLTNYDVAIPSVVNIQSKLRSKAKANLGTIVGVYLPCIQNIFGVIFFIRLVWIVGTAGVPVAFTIVLLCCCVTFTTCISLSAIATNGIVPAGGSYFMLSRSLGPEFGGAVGILFYLATTFAGALYIVGAVEIFLIYLAPSLSLFGDFKEDQEIMYHNFRTYGTILLILIGIMVFIGVSFVSKLAPVALFCVIVSIICIYIGVFVNIFGTDDLKICVLGDRILASTHLGVEYKCSKEINISNSLFHLYCSTETVKNNSENRNYVCDPYFEENDVKYIRALPGLASGVLTDNIKPNFRSKGEVISLSNSNVFRNHEDKTYNQILVDIKTSFMVLIAIFFPSCTGIMAGSNRSGDLADAQKSIPKGTLAAHLTTSFIYLSGVLFFGASFDNLFLRDKFGESIGGGLAVSYLAWPHPLVIVCGSLLSTIGAGLQSLTGAPRLLHAIAKDQIIPFLKPFSRTTTRNEPKRALFVTLCICELGILIGNLDHIAPILTMFFLMCYMSVNIACTLQSLLRTPSWRPRFKFYHWSLSLIGALLCLVVMFLSGWYYALSSIGIAGIIYKYIEYRGAEKEWGDGIRGLELSAAHYSLLHLEEGPIHTKNYRPQVLVLCKLKDNLMPKYRKVISFASQLKAGNGLTLINSVIEGDFIQNHCMAQTAKQNLKKVMEEEKVKGFASALVTNNVSEGLCHIIQTAGLGGLNHNTVILCWPGAWREIANQKSWKLILNAIRAAIANKNALLIPKGINKFPDNTDKLSGTIDSWWIVHDGGLLMLIPFLLKKHKTWEKCKFRIFTVAQLEDNSIQMEKDVKTFLYHLRIEAEVEIVEMIDTDISAYTYERTLKMEQRTQMSKQIRLNRSGKLNMTIADSSADNSAIKVLFDEMLEEEEKDSSKVIENPIINDEEKNSSSEKKEFASKHQFSETKLPKISNQDDSSECIEIENVMKEEIKQNFKELAKLQPDEANVLRMHAAMKLNEVILSKSRGAQLIVLNLPGLPKAAETEENYMEFTEVLTEGMNRVLMVRGSGCEVMTIYS